VSPTPLPPVPVPQPPVSLPPPPPPVTVTVQVPPDIAVHLPPETVDKLGSTHSLGDWLYSNGATLLAIAAAIGAAWWAYCSVKKQIAANNEAVTKQISAEDRRRDQQIRADIVIEANELAYHVHAWAKGGTGLPPGHVLSRSKDVDSSEDSLGGLVEILGLKLRLFQMRAQNDALMRFWEEAKERAKSSSDIPGFELRYNELLGHLKAVVPETRTGLRQPPGGGAVAPFFIGSDKDSAPVPVYRGKGWVLQNTTLARRSDQIVNREIGSAEPI
jgi:hypothetical protein